MFEVVQEIDIDLRRVDALQASVPQLAPGESLMGGLSAGLGDLKYVQNQLNELLDSFRVAESLSGALRKSLRPARTGLTAINDSISIMNEWRDTTTQVES